MSHFEELINAGVPEDPSEMVDAMQAVRAVRLAIEKKVDLLKSLETKIKNSLIDVLSDNDQRGVFGKTNKAQLKTSEVYYVEDWSLLRGYIAQTNNFEILSKAITQKAVSETIAETGSNVPGIQKMQVHKVSITKI